MEELHLSATECMRRNDIRRTEMHIAEPLVPEASSSEVEIAIGNLRRSPGTDQILTKLMEAGGNTFHSEIHKPVNSIWNKEHLPQQWKNLLLYLFIKRVIKLITIIIEEYHSYQLHTKFYPLVLSQG
jgi:hypothetical protein